MCLSVCLQYVCLTVYILSFVCLSARMYVSWFVKKVTFSLHTLVFIVHLLLWISMENMLLFCLYEWHRMDDHTLHGEYLSDCLSYRRAVADSQCRCRTACLHVTIYLCLQTVCLCHWLSIFCMASFFSGVYLSACSNLLSQRQLSWSHLSVITVRSSGCRMTSLIAHRRELGSWRQTGSQGFTHGVNPERSLDELI